MSYQAREILVTGGAGYVGAVLVPRLLEEGYLVRVLDLYLFDERALSAVAAHPHLTQIRGDIRDGSVVRKAVKGCDTVIHLACISNDPSFELNPGLSRTINFECFQPLVRCCKEAGVRRFIFAASSSVYGISGESDVTEQHPHLPVTDYNKYKSLCESVLWREKAADFVPVSIRPATLCGFSPRMRLDLTVNILTTQAVFSDKITVFGGSQMRPNLHIDDMADLYLLLLKVPAEKIASEAFNAGYENHTVLELAGLVKKVILQKLPKRKDIRIVQIPSDDTRSYHISSEKIKRVLGFEPKRTIEQAVSDLVDAFDSGKIPDPLTESRYYNVKKLKEINLK